MDDYQVDDLFEKHKAKKKKIDSGKKGDRGELEIVHLLNKRFAKILSENSWGEFSKSSGSGNRWAQVKNLPQHAKATYSGDITIPTNCLWVFESKNGYDDVDIFRCFKGKCTELDEFLQQVQDDADRSGRKPMLIWKKTRQERVAFIHNEDMPPVESAYRLHYKGWIAVPLSVLLNYKDSYFFTPPTLTPPASSGG